MGTGGHPSGQPQLCGITICFRALKAFTQSPSRVWGSQDCGQLTPGSWFCPAIASHALTTTPDTGQLLFREAGAQHPPVGVAQIPAWGSSETPARLPRAALVPTGSRSQPGSGPKAVERCPGPCCLQQGVLWPSWGTPGLRPFTHLPGERGAERARWQVVPCSQTHGRPAPAARHPQSPGTLWV